MGAVVEYALHIGTGPQGEDTVKKKGRSGLIPDDVLRLPVQVVPFLQRSGTVTGLDQFIDFRIGVVGIVIEIPRP